MTLIIEIQANNILVSGDGFSTLIEAQQHFRDLSAILVRQRRRGIGARVMVDLREGAPQTEEITEHIKKAMAVIFQDADRVALIVGSCLTKASIQHLHARHGHGVFISKSGAEEFLSRD